MTYAPEPPKVWYWLGCRAMSLLTALLARWRVEGTARAPTKGPLLVVANHLSFVDPPLLAASFPRPLTFVAKAELWDALPSRLFCQAMGFLPLRRGEADRSALRSAVEVLEQGRAIGFFPEGTRGRQRTNALKRAHGGAALLAHLSGAPIVPVGIAGTEVLNSAADIFAQAWRRPPFSVRIGEPFLLPTIEGMPSSRILAEHTDSIMVRIARLLPEAYWGVYADSARASLKAEGIEV